MPGLHFINNAGENTPRARCVAHRIKSIPLLVAEFRLRVVRKAVTGHRAQRWGLEARHGHLCKWRIFILFFGFIYVFKVFCQEYTAFEIRQV